MNRGIAACHALARAAVAALLALALAWVSPPLSRAGTRSQLEDAKAKLSRLEAQIATQRAALESAHTAILRLSAEVQAAQEAYVATRQRLIQVQGSLSAAQAEYDDDGALLDQQAANAYMQGPGSDLKLLLQATSVGDLMDRLEFLDRVAQTEADLANEVRSLENRLMARKKEVQSLLRRQAAQLARLSEREAALAASFAQQESRLAAMARDRSQIVDLLAKLRKQLRAQELAAARASLLGTNTAPFGAWASLLLPRLGVPSCHGNMVVIVAWETAEYTQAAWNPLATTYPMPGAGNFNSVGVKNYASIDQGLQATVLTLHQGNPAYGYGSIIDSLARCSDPLATGDAIRASAWCRGCAGGAYVVDIIPAVEAYYSRYAHL